MASNEGKLTGFMMFFLFIGAIIFTLYDIFRTDGIRITAFLLPIFVLSINFMNRYGIWSIWLKGKGFQWKTGVKGTIVRGPYPVDNKRIKYFVSVYGGYLSDEKKKHALGAFWYFYFLVSQRVIIEVVDYAHKFKEIPSQNCDDPRGVVTYDGSPNDTPVWDLDSYLQQENEILHHRIGIVQTGMKNVNLELETLANSRDRNVVKVARTIKSIMTQVDKPIIISGGMQPGMVDLNQQHRRDF